MTVTTLADFSDLLDSHWKRVRAHSLRKLFSDNPGRFEQMSVHLDGLVFDYSKNHLDQSAMDALLDVAEKCGLAAQRNAMFAGAKLNVTEQRAVLHTALRNLGDDTVIVDGEDVMPSVREVRARMADFSDAVRAGDYTVSGNRVTDIINIGIGGSDLGPKLVAAALDPWADGPRAHFVSNVDPSDIASVTGKLDPASTLVNIASKTFTTQETMANAGAARAWLESAGDLKVDEHFCAVSTNLEATRAFGIPDERTFGFWDWVGGRYSVWGAIGLPVMVCVGPDAFAEFLEGAHQADQHFREAPFTENIPVLMGLISIWNRNVCGHEAQAVLPYDNRLADLPRWLQQLAMESNGKSVTGDGKPVPVKTSPVIFGEPGTNGQHAFYQLLHQGRDMVPCDFLVAAKGHESDLDDQHRTLVAHCIAQSEALMAGRTLSEADGNPHRVFGGNRPSNTFVYGTLDPATLGKLMAFYEHRTFVEGTLWGINSFDQFGVELGKELAKRVEPFVGSAELGEVENASTRGLLQAVAQLRKS